MTIAQRLLLTLFVAMLSILVTGGYGILELSRASQRINELRAVSLPYGEMVARTETAVANLCRLDLRYVAADKSQRAEIEAEAAKADTVLGDRLAAYEKLWDTVGSGDQFVKRDHAALDVLRNARGEFMNVARTGDRSDATSRLDPGGAVDVASAQLVATLERHAEHERQRENTEREATTDGFARVSWILVGAATFGLIVTGAIGIRAYRIITRALQFMKNTFQRVGSTLDFSVPATVRCNDEVGETAKAFNLLLERVSQTVSLVRRSAESVSAGAHEMATGNTDLSARTEEQAAALEQTAASMEQLTATVRQNVETARAASELSARAAESSRSGHIVVERMAKTMEQISSASERITEITTMIDTIAFQTNILALNASVEAARAGELGRGFAVVAGEVRALAQRSSGAAKEIKALIAGSVDTVRRGAVEAKEVGDATDEILCAVDQVTTLIGEIANSSEEQARGIEQVSQAIVQMDQVTQQNAALVEEATAAAQLLDDEATSLTGAVAAFKLAV